MVTINIHDSTASTQKDKAVQVSDSPSPQGINAMGSDNAAATNSEAPDPQTSQGFAEGNSNSGDTAPSPSGMGLAGESSETSADSQQAAGASGPPPTMTEGGNASSGSSSPEPNMQMGSQEGAASGETPSPVEQQNDNDAEGKKSGKEEPKKK